MTIDGCGYSRGHRRGRIGESAPPCWQSLRICYCARAECDADFRVAGVTLHTLSRDRGWTSIPSCCGIEPLRNSGARVGARVMRHFAGVLLACVLAAGLASGPGLSQPAAAPEIGNVTSAVQK